MRRWDDIVYAGLLLISSIARIMCGSGPTEKGGKDGCNYGGNHAENHIAAAAA
jgi:hypothetical protein